MKVTPAQVVFNRGEVGPLLYYRSDLDMYAAAVRLALNSVPLVQGAMTRRPRTNFVANARYDDRGCIIIPFQFSTTEAYILEVGDLYFRIYRDNGRVESPPGTPVTVATPWLEADLPLLKWVQSADVIYVTHPSYQPRKISRTSDTAWTVTPLVTRDGPYLPTNTTATTLTPSGVTGAITVTASSVVGINGGAGFNNPGDVGRLIRLYTASPGVWGYVRIDSVGSTTVVNATVMSGLSAAAATTGWRLGSWSNTTGWPTCAVFFEDRLWFGGAGATPSRLDGSATADYENFYPTQITPAHTTAFNANIADDNAVAVSLNSSDVQRIVSMLDDDRGLAVFTKSGEWIVRGSEVQRNTITPTNINAKQSTKYGSADAQALRAGDGLLMIQRSRRKMRENAYVYSEDKYKSPNMTLLAEHLTKGGLRGLTFQQEPHSIVWSTLQTNALRGFTYERDQQVTAWHQHQLGGYANVGHTLPPDVLAIGVIPSPDESYDQLWLIVRRYVNGQTRVFVEVMNKFYEDGDDVTQSACFDSALLYDGAVTTTITGLDHLANETVSVIADGAAHPDVTVTALGAATLTRSFSKACFGLPYNSDVRTMRFAAGSQNGSSAGKKQEINKVRFDVYKGLGLKVGPDFTRLSEITFRTSGMSSDAAVPLATGIYPMNPWPKSMTDGRDETVCWRWYQGFPGTIRAVMPTIDTQDDG